MLISWFYQIPNTPEQTSAMEIKDDSTSNKLNRLETDTAKIESFEILESKEDSQTNLVPGITISQTSTGMPEPINGFDSYNSYLGENLKYGQNAIQNELQGDVIIEFSVDSLNNLSNFRIIQGLDKDLDQEAIRLIQNGPKWNTYLVDSSNVNYIAQVVMHFTLSKQE